MFQDICNSCDVKIPVLSLSDCPRNQNLSWRLAFRRCTGKSVAGVGQEGKRGMKRKGRGREGQGCLESEERPRPMYLGINQSLALSSPRKL